MYLRDYLHDIPLKALKTIAGTLGLSVEYNARIKLMNAIDRAFWDPAFTTRLVEGQDEPHRQALSLVAFTYRRGASGKALIRKLERIAAVDRQSADAILVDLAARALVMGVEAADDVYYRCPDEIGNQVRALFLAPLAGGKTVETSYQPPHLMEDIHAYLAAALRNDIPLTQKGAIRKTAQERIFTVHGAPGPSRMPARLRNGIVAEYALKRGLVTVDHRGVTAAGPLGGWLGMAPRARFADVLDFALLRLLGDDTAVLVFAGVLSDLTPDRVVPPGALAEFLADHTMAGGGLSRLDRRVRDALAMMSGLGLAAVSDDGFVLTDTGRRLLAGKPLPLDEAEGDTFTVQPNFDIVAGPELRPRVRFLLELFADRKQRDTVLIFHLTRDGVARAMERGMSRTEVLAFFQRHSRTTLPQNVRFSLESWAAAYGRIGFQAVTLMRLEDPELAAGVRHDPTIAPFIVEWLSDTSAVVAARQVPRLREALRNAGHYTDIFGVRPPEPLLDSEPFVPAPVPGPAGESSGPPGAIWFPAFPGDEE